jgi:predicted MFS family arabinose efflux permease
MRKFPKEKMWQAIACLACIAVLWIRLDDYGVSEFSGGWVTGRLLDMADVGSLFFLVASLLTFFLRRIAATIALAAVLLCFLFYLYILVPGLYLWIFKAESFMPRSRPLYWVYWNNWAVLGIISLLFATILSLRSYSKFHLDV